MAALAGIAFCTEAGAQDLVYEAINPSFGGSSFNSAHLLAIANAQNDYDPPERPTTSRSELDRFIRSLQSWLMSSLSTQLANVIFGEDAQDEGTITFGDQTVQFVRTLDGIVLTITDPDGTQTMRIPPEHGHGPLTRSQRQNGQRGRRGDHGKGHRVGRHLGQWLPHRHLLQLARGGHGRHVQ